LANAVPLDQGVDDLAVTWVSGYLGIWMGIWMGIWNLIRGIGGMFPTVFWWSSPQPPALGQLSAAGLQKKNIALASMW